MIRRETHTDKQHVTSSTTNIIGATWVIPVDKETLQHANSAFGEVLPDYGLLIDGDKIAAIAPFQQLLADFPTVEAIFYEDHILAPGLINCHNHAAMSLLRGIADDHTLSEWLEEHIWPAEKRWVSEPFVHDGARLAMAEMLLSGTTTFSDMYFFPDVTAHLAESIGMRAQINFPIVEFASSWASNAGEYIDKGLQLFDEHRHSTFVSIGFAPHAPYTVSDQTFERIVMLAEEVDTHIQIHLHETARELSDSIAQYGASPVQRLHRLGVLSPRTQAVHMTQCDDTDLQVLHDTDTRIVHCPASNLKLASGYCQIERFSQAGIHVGLGTDSAASNNTLDMFESVRQSALLAKHQSGNATAMNASQSLYHATLGGAHCLGIHDITGSLRTGKQADIIAIDTRHPAMQPVHDPVSLLVYTQVGQAVEHVWVAGRQKVKSGQLVDIDQQQLHAVAKSWQQRLSE